MYLYNKKSNKIEIYSIIPNKKKICNYRRKEMKNISPNEKVLKAVTNSDCIFLKGGIGFDHLAHDVYKKPRLFDNSFHDLQSYEQTEDQKKKQSILLNKYYNDELINIKLHTVSDFDNQKEMLKVIKYLLVTEKYVLDESNNIKVLNNIIQISKSLYTLESFLLNSSLDDNMDIEEEVDLFDISQKPLETLDFDVFMKSDKYNLTSASVTSVLNKVNRSQKILKYIKNKPF